MTLSAFQSAFEPVLQAYLAEQRQRTAWMTDPTLAGFIRYPGRLLAGGKRIRPYLANLMYRACGGLQTGAILRVGIGLELFHLYGLIHDDIMDHGAVRHGISTLHRHAADVMREEGRVGDAAHIGVSQALLVGNILNAWAWETFVAADAFSPAALRDAQHIFFQMSEEVMYGQMLDVDLTTRDRASVAEVMAKMRYKTASYTCIRPLLIGAALTGQRASWEAFAERLGFALGCAFQIQDDWIDLTTSSEGSGKTALSDLSERQHTLFTQYVFDHGTAEEQRACVALMGAQLTEADRPRVVALFRDSGAMAYGMEQMTSQFAIAEEALQEAGFTEEIVREFEELFAHIRRRVF